MQFPFPTIITGVGNIFAAVSSILASLFQPVIGSLRWLAAMNARWAAFLLGPIATRAPWLANILLPLARLNPVLALLQGILLVAALPYLIAAAGSVAVFAYSLVVEFVVNTIKVVADYYKAMKDSLSDIWQEFRNENRTIWQNRVGNNTLIRGQNFVINYASLFIRMPSQLVWGLISGAVFVPFEILTNTYSDAYESAGTAYKIILETPLLRLMRTPWTKLEDVQELEETSEEVMKRNINEISQYAIEAHSRAERLEQGLGLAFNQRSNRNEFTVITGLQLSANSTLASVQRLEQQRGLQPLTSATPAASLVTHEQLRVVSDRVTGVEARASGLEERATRNEGSISGLTTNLSGVTTKVSTFEKGMTGLTTNLSSITTKVGTVEKSLTGLSERVAISEKDTTGVARDLIGLAERFVTTEVLGGLTTRVGTAERDIGGLTTRVGTAEKDLGGLTTRLGKSVTEIQSDLRTVGTSAQAANEKLTGLTDKVARAEGDITGIKNKMAGSAASVAQSDLGVRMTAAEGTLTAHVGVINQSSAAINWLLDNFKLPRTGGLLSGKSAVSDKPAKVGIVPALTLAPL